MTDITDAKQRQTLINKADSAAYAHLRKKYADEFATVKQAEAQKLGVDWKPKPTKAERDRAELRRILGENPELRDELRRSVADELNAGRGAEAQ